ncbi:hypothetical protein NM208_g14118 [Fusarium decemcellulare]|uniref:Uncharacterized protein n=1 Tax=Fusarium decemcellulare TaxID=57161 RepID=A0ACC1RJX1_9HYPO|nr:hypothetical protein NM208_g14118 [Fusarium decemcellulare]
MPSEQIKKLASSITALGNEKMREEKAADKGGKKTKAAKTKTSLVTGRANAADTSAYDDNDDFGESLEESSHPPPPICSAVARSGLYISGPTSELVFSPTIARLRRAAGVHIYTTVLDGFASNPFRVIG